MSSPTRWMRSCSGIAFKVAGCVGMNFTKGPSAPSLQQAEHQLRARTDLRNPPRISGDGISPKQLALNQSTMFDRSGQTKFEVYFARVQAAPAGMGRSRGRWRRPPRLGGGANGQRLIDTVAEKKGSLDAVRQTKNPPRISADGFWRSNSL
jgi:hypothetical protein